MERRTQETLRNHYNQVEKCYNCKGTEKESAECDYSIYNKRIGKCVYKISIENDLEKISNDMDNLKYPILKEIINRKIKRHVPRI